MALIGRGGLHRAVRGSSKTGAIRAAGAVLWRPGPDGAPEVALVHRPRYDDWSLPKGKLDRGEHWLGAAVREVAEETGQGVALGRPLPAQHYEALGRPKEVRYWAARATGGVFIPSDEVDEIAWLGVEPAAARLTRDLDVDVLAAFAAAPHRTAALIVLRHAHARSRDGWSGPPAERPLDATGLAETKRLIPLLAAFGPARVLSSPARRAVQSVEPFARAAGLAIERVPGLAEGADPAASADALRTVLDLARAGTPALVCSHGPPLPPLLGALAVASGAELPSGDADLSGVDRGADLTVEPPAKSEFVVFHLAAGRAVATERHLP